MLKNTIEIDSQNPFCRIHSVLVEVVDSEKVMTHILIVLNATLESKDKKLTPKILRSQTRRRKQRRNSVTPS